MAYIGLCNLVLAPIEGNEYGTGFSLPKAVMLDADPQYEDVSDYNDINDLEPEEEFQYAIITIRVTDETTELSGEMDGDFSEQKDIDDRKRYGVGYIRQWTSGRFEAGWLNNVKLREAGMSQETRGESIEYGVPEYTGKAYPDQKGSWKQKQVFRSKEEALLFIHERANMEVNNG